MNNLNPTWSQVVCNISEISNVRISIDGVKYNLWGYDGLKLMALVGQEMTNSPKSEIYAEYYFNQAWKKFYMPRKKLINNYNELCKNRKSFPAEIAKNLIGSQFVQDWQVLDTQIEFK